MKQENHLKKDSQSVRWNDGRIIFLILAAVFIYVAFILPIPRQIGLLFRQDLFVLPFLFLLVILTCFIKQSALRGVLYAILFFIGILPLSGLLNSGASDQYVLGGVIPWSDAFTIQMHTLKFLYGQQMGATTALRPISTVFYGIVLVLSNNNFLLLSILLAVLCGLLIVLNTHLVNRVFGSVAASFFFCNAFFYIRGHLGEFMTEVYGFMAGMIACYLLILGTHGKKRGVTIAGMVALSIAMIARPGPMLILPLVGLWFFLQQKTQSKKFLWLIIAIVAVGSGFLINKFNTLQVYGSTKIPSRSAAEIIYGLCLGGKDSYHAMFLPEMIALNDSDNVARDLTSLCSAVLKEHPENILISLKAIFRTLLFDNLRGPFSYFTGTSREGLITGLRMVLLFLWLYGVAICHKQRSNPLYSLLLMMFWGYFLMQFFLAPFTTFKMRYDAAVIWAPGLLIGMLPQQLFNRAPSKNAASTNPPRTGCLDGTVYGLFGVILLAAIFGAFLLRQFPLSIPKSALIDCAPNETVIFTRIDRGSYFYMDERNKLETEHYPTFRLPYVRQHFHDTASVEMFDFTDTIDQPTAIARGIDLDNWKDILIFAPLDKMKGKEGFVQMCGNFLNPPVLRQDRFFLPTKVQFLKP